MSVAAVLGSLITFVWSLHPVEHLTNKCHSPFASDLDRADQLDLYGHQAEAVDLYSAHLAAHPDDTGSLLRRGRAYLELGNADAAIADLSEVLRRQPNTLDAFRPRGDASMLKHDYGAAIADYSRVLDRPGGDRETSLFYQRGLAALGAGSYDLALSDFNKVLAVETSDVESAKGRDCAAKKSNNGECASLPFDRDPEGRVYLKRALAKTSDCRWRPGWLFGVLG